MNANTIQPLTPGPADDKPAHRDSAVRGTAERRSVLFGLALALPATPVLLILGTNWQAIQLLWIVALIWTIVASFVHALRQGICHGDWSAFRCGEIPRNDGDLDFATKTGRYAFIRIRACHEEPHAHRRPVLAGSQSHQPAMSLSAARTPTQRLAIQLFVTRLKDVLSMKLHRESGVTQITARYVLHRLRQVWLDEAALDGMTELMMALLEDDETWIGVEPRNMSGSKRPAAILSYFPSLVGLVV